MTTTTGYEHWALEKWQHSCAQLITLQLCSFHWGMYHIAYLVLSQFFNQVMANNDQLKTRVKRIRVLGYFDDGRLNWWLILNMLIWLQISGSIGYIERMCSAMCVGLCLLELFCLIHYLLVDLIFLHDSLILCSTSSPTCRFVVFHWVSSNQNQLPPCNKQWWIAYW
jgi:hypothetical protein